MILESEQIMNKIWSKVLKTQNWIKILRPPDLGRKRQIWTDFGTRIFDSGDNLYEICPLCR